jgi:hypothetical protein
MKFLRLLRYDWRVYLFYLLFSIWAATAVGIQIAFIVAHHRLPVSEYEVFNWLVGWSS